MPATSRDPNYMRKWSATRQLRRQEMIGKYKLTLGCADCGYRQRAGVLQFDHVRGEKLASIARLYTRPLHILWAEVAKCDVVCANCHAARTQDRYPPRRWLDDPHIPALRVG